jgi:hypothetical protein
VVQLSSRKLTERRPFPQRVTGIRIGRKCHALFFLHATQGESGDGVLVATYSVHYSNNSTEDIPVIFGKDVRSFWTGPHEALTTTRSELVWVGSSPAVQSESKSLRIFKSTWRNSHPDEPIETIDLVSTMSEAAPFLAALTAK